MFRVLRCYIPVSVDKVEAENILKYCSENKIDIDYAILKKQNDSYQREANYKKLMFKDRKCVFLKNNLCSIYPVRPLECRKHLVISEPKYCNTKNNPNGKTASATHTDVRALVYAFDINLGNLSWWLLKIKEVP